MAGTTDKLAVGQRRAWITEKPDFVGTFHVMKLSDRLVWYARDGVDAFGKDLRSKVAQISTLLPPLPEPKTQPGPAKKLLTGLEALRIIARNTKARAVDILWVKNFSAAEVAKLSE